jgi:hypothetical protein
VILDGLTGRSADPDLDRDALLVALVVAKLL